MNTPELIRRKREGSAIAPGEIEDFVSGYVAGRIPDYQVSAFLMAVFFQGMTPEEAAALTRAMISSGVRYDLGDIKGPKVDKHSTGGVGDKVSLVLAPLVAAAGGIVPMVSGRGLGHTGGTLDKLDAIPGYRWDLDEGEFRRMLGRVGCAIIGQTGSFVPADKKLYALRDVTATVESIPLICASILSKKCAAGTKFLCMDVKCGSGAFMDSEEKARRLARGLSDIGTTLGMRVSTLITQMNQPLGVTIGNALEVRECIDILKGDGPGDSTEITLELCGEMLTMSGLATDHAAARKILDALISTGQALDKFVQWITGQGGDARIVDDPGLLVVSREVDVLEAQRDGHIHSMQTRDIGVAANLLGAGRQSVTDDVDLAVGLECLKKPGDRVARGEPLFRLYHRNRRGLDMARAMIRGAIMIGDEPVEKLPLIIGRE